MRSSRARLILVFVALIAFLFVAAFLYQVGMATLEGKPRSFLDSLAWAAETLSTTGYGADSKWTHPAMVALVIFVQFVGVFLVFLIIPIVLLPFLAARFEQRVPRVADEHLANHVIVFRYGPAVESLVQRLDAAGVRTLVVETDEEQARRVIDAKQAVVYSPSEEDALDVARIHKARAVVANGRDEENAALILRARQMGFRGVIYAFVEDPAHRKPMELAGATAAYTPRHIVAAALAAHASDRLSPRLPGLEHAAGLMRREIRVAADSPLAGKTLEEAQLGAIVVGRWWRSHLETRCTRDMRIEPGAILELVGDEAALARAAQRAKARFLNQEGPFIIAGFGEVGRKVHELLTDVGEEVRVIERHEGPGVDIAGDVLDSSVLERAGVRRTRGLILALDSDDSTLFATVIARDAAPDVPVIARVNHGRNLENIHRAGADYALSISDVSGEMLSSRLLGKTTRARDEHRRVVRLSGAHFAGRAVHDLGFGEAGCSLLAVERDGTVRLMDDPSVPFDAEDVLWVCGTAEGIRKMSAATSS
ncbi:MAG: NAD-binding protein [Thermoanaerobaculia bacterium]|nr:NAD-binding protein [Thermoanaerobaculia bacterium]